MNQPLNGPWHAEWEYEADRDSYRVFCATGRALILCEQRVIAEIQIDHASREHADAIVQLILAAPALLGASMGSVERLHAAIERATKGRPA